jgi:hypothetical protein
VTKVLSEKQAGVRVILEYGEGEATFCSQKFWQCVQWLIEEGMQYQKTPAMGAFWLL